MKCGRTLGPATISDMSILSMSREEHYLAIENYLAAAEKSQTMNPGKSAVYAATAQVHASVLVEKALRDAQTPAE